MQVITVLRLHTIDLNKGPISPPTAGATAPEETTGVTTLDPAPGPVTPTSPDDEDQASSGAEDGDTLFEEDESNGDGEEVE